MPAVHHNATNMTASSRSADPRSAVGLRVRSGCWALVAVLVTVAAFACTGGDSPFAIQVEAGKASCQPLREAKGYRYKAWAQVDLAVRTADMPREDPDRGSSALLMTTDITGSIQTPDRYQALVKYPDPGYPDLNLIVIGDLYWTEEEGQWSGTRLGPQDIFPVPYLPHRICESIVQDIDTNGVDSVPEEVGGIPARKYHFDELATSFLSNLDEWGPQSDPGRLLKKVKADVWISDEGSTILKMDVIADGAYETGRRLTLKVSMETWDFNAGIKIDPPEESQP